MSEPITPVEGSGRLTQSLRSVGLALGLIPPRLDRARARKLLVISAALFASFPLWRLLRGDGASLPTPLACVLVLLCIVHARSVAVAAWRLVESTPRIAWTTALGAPHREPLLKCGWVLIALIEITVILGEPPWNLLSLAPLTAGRIPALHLWVLGLGLIQWLVLWPAFRNYEVTRSIHERAAWLAGRVVIWFQVLANAAAEELLFRYAQLQAISTALGGDRSGEATAIVVSSGLFGLAHAYRGQPAGARGAAQMTILGVLLGILAVSLGTIWGGFLIHAFVLGTYGARRWLARWAELRRPLGFVPFFAYSAGERWYLTSVEGAWSWNLCRDDSRLGEFLRLARDRHPGIVLGLPWSEAKALFTEGAPEDEASWIGAPGGLAVWRHSMGTLFTDAGRSSDQFPSAVLRESTARSAVDLGSKSRYEIRARITTSARSSAQDPDASPWNLGSESPPLSSNPRTVGG